MYRKKNTTVIKHHCGKIYINIQFSKQVMDINLKFGIEFITIEENWREYERK